MSALTTAVHEETIGTVRASSSRVSVEAIGVSNEDRALTIAQVIAWVARSTSSVCEVMRLAERIQRLALALAKEEASKASLAGPIWSLFLAVGDDWRPDDA